MLERSFTHLRGVGPAFERRLADAGIYCWDDALSSDLPCPPSKARTIRQGLEESRQRLEAGDACWFSHALTPSEQWRLYAHFGHSAAYVDIETDGLPWPDGSITTIALYDGQSVRTYVRHRNLEAFADDILAYKLLVTWNGRGFDAPILRRVLQIPLDQRDHGHLDLLPVYRRMGLRGGLKKVEKALGIDREELDGVDGWAAVRLWRAFERDRDERILDTLLAYNVADVINLEGMARYAYARCTAEADDLLPPPCQDFFTELFPNPYRPHPEVLRRVLGLVPQQGRSDLPEAFGW